MPQRASRFGRDLPHPAVLNYRPEYRHDWGNHASYTQLRLQPLAAQSAEEMLTALLGDNIEVVPLKRLIIEKTEGTPFFIEETVQALIEDGTLIRNELTKVTRSLSRLRIPATVQAILASRIDRLPAAEKQLLQTLAAIGTEFSLKLSAQVVGKPEAELVPMLSHLQQREYIYEQLSAGDIEYSFKHALTHDVAYGSLLVDRRKLLHERVADSMESLYAASLDDHLRELAHHYGRSGNARKAAQYALAAGEQALRRAAHADSITYLNSGVQSLKALSQGQERDRLELKLLLALWEPLTAVEGFAGRQVEETLNRAKELCRSVGNVRQVGSVFRCRSLLHLLKSDFNTAIELATQGLELACRIHDPALEFLGHEQVGMLSVFLGHFVSAREHLDKAMAISSRLPSSTGLALGRTVRDETVHCMNVAARNSWFLGYPEQALKMSRDVLASARLRSPIVHNFALSWITMLRLELRDWTTALELAEEYVASAIRHELSYTSAEAIVLRGVALVYLGDAERGIAEIRRGIDEAENTGATRVEGFLFLADCYARIGHAAEGLAALDRAERLRDTGLGSDFLRINGELLLACQPPEEQESETCFRRAIEVAQSQMAKSLELRAAICLARLIRKQGKLEEARVMLAKIYDWFTEGFDTADLKEAKALLNDVNPTRSGA